MLVPNRNYQSPEYRYGFQGQEKDDEVKGNGNSVNYKYRMHDPRVGRFFAVDPLASRYTHNSPYAFSENRVIDRIELEGLESHQFFDDFLLKTRPHLKTDSAGSTRFKVIDNALTKIWNGVVETGRLLRGRPLLPITEEEKQDAKRDVENEKAIVGALIKEISYNPAIEVSEKLDSMIDGTYVPPTKAERLEGLENLLSLGAEVGVLSRLTKTGKVKVKLCFVKGTLVLSKEGLVSIEKIKIGDLVLSYNEISKKNEFKKVLELSKNLSSHIRVLVIDGEIIETTDEHPFFQNGEWIEAKNLQIGSVLTTSKFQGKILEKSYLIKKEVDIFNFEVSGNNNYYVSNLEILVHNNCDLNSLNISKLKSKFSGTKIRKIKEVYSDIKNGKAKGHPFENDGRENSVILPKKGKGGDITYKTYDLNKPPTAAQRANGAGRDRSRLIVGSDGSVHHTNQHYTKVTKITD